MFKKESAEGLHGRFAVGFVCKRLVGMLFQRNGELMKKE